MTAAVFQQLTRLTSDVSTNTSAWSGGVGLGTAVDWGRGLAYQLSSDGTIRIYSLASLTCVRAATQATLATAWPHLAAGSEPDGICCGVNTQLYIWRSIGSSGGNYLWIIDPTTLTVTAEKLIPSSAYSEILYLICFTVGATEVLAGHLSYDGGFVYNPATGSFGSAATQHPTAALSVTVMRGNGTDIWFLVGTGAGTTITITKAQLTGTAPATGLTSSTAATLTGLSFGLAATSGSQDLGSVSAVFDPTDGTLVLHNLSFSGFSYSGKFSAKWSSAGVVWVDLTWGGPQCPYVNTGLSAGVIAGDINFASGISWVDTATAARTYVTVNAGDAARDPTSTQGDIHFNSLENAFVYQDNDSFLYLVTLGPPLVSLVPPVSTTTPAVGRTFVYDLVTQLWHERSSGADGSGIWGYLTAAALDARLLLGDAVNGNLYHMDSTIGTEDGVVVPRLAVLPEIRAHGLRGFMNRLEVEMEVGTAGSPPAVTLDWSDDGGITFTPYQRVLRTGALGATRTRVATTRLGSFRKRALRLQALGKTTIYGVDSDVPIMSDAFATVQTSAAGKPGLLPIPLASRSYALASAGACSERLLNFHAEKLPPHAGGEFFLKPTAGTTLFATMGTGPIVCTASLAGGFWAISGDHAYFMLDGSSVPADLGYVGTVPTAAYTPSIAIGLDGVVFCVPPNAYRSDLAGSAVVQLTPGADNFPTLGCSSVCYMDGYYVFTSFDTTEMFVSPILALTGFDALAFVRLSAFTDYIQRIVTHNSEAWLFGDQAVQVWYDGGDPTFPFLPQFGAVIKHGIGAVGSVVELDGTLLYLGIDKVVYQIKGYQAARVSDHALEELLANYGGGALDGITACGFMHEGHAFYALSLPLAPAALT